MQTVAFVKGNIDEIEYLLRIVNGNPLCKCEVYTIVNSDMYAIKALRYKNICLSVLQSVLHFAKVTIVEEDGLFGETL